ncbi:MAG: hypothetical protein WEB06_18620, partial [Actinomycetota bacterium]
AAAKAAAPKMLWVRARAGDAVGKPTQVKVAAGGVAPAPVPGVLPATGVDPGLSGLTLLLAALAVAALRRRTRVI